MSFGGIFFKDIQLIISLGYDNEDIYTGRFTNSYIQKLITYALGHIEWANDVIARAKNG
jgi:hypothetical protein